MDETLPVVGLPEDAKASAVKEEGAAQDAQLHEQMSTGGFSEEAEALMANDRWLDRFMARMGRLDDAPALFSPGKNVPWAGVMMAAVILSNSPFLGLAQKVYGSIGPAFYGLRTVMMTYIIMILLRICRIEDVRQADSRKLDPLFANMSEAPV